MSNTTHPDIKNYLIEVNNDIQLKELFGRWRIQVPADYDYAELNYPMWVGGERHSGEIKNTSDLEYFTEDKPGDFSHNLTGRTYEHYIISNNKQGEPIPTDYNDWKKDMEIVCISDEADAFTKDWIYKLREDVDYLNPMARVYEDDKGVTNGWYASNFNLMVNTTQQGEPVATKVEPAILKWGEIPKGPTTDDPFGIEPAKVVWYNPKQNKPNVRMLKLGDKVMVNEMESPQEIESITGDDMCELTNGHTRKMSELYPIYPADTLNLSIGDVITNAKGDYGVLVSQQMNGMWRVKSDNYNGEISIAETNTRYTFKPDIKEVESYTCGTLSYKGHRYPTREELQKAYPSTEFNISESKYTVDMADISKHYQIDIEEISPKEDLIMKKLIQTLDNPINVEAKEWAMLVGPSGSGKSQLAVEYADNQNREYIKQQMSAQVTSDDFLGYCSLTTGDYFPSLLRDAVEHGKIFIIDEIDSSNSNTLLILNGLKQDYFQFPDKLIKIHKDFRIIATANTLKYDEQYNSRQPMDLATIARFHVIQYDMANYHMSVRYGLKYLKQIKDSGLTPREIERQVRQLKIKESNEL